MSASKPGCTPKTVACVGHLLSDPDCRSTGLKDLSFGMCPASSLGSYRTCLSLPGTSTCETLKGGFLPLPVFFFKGLTLLQATPFLYRAPTGLRGALLQSLWPSTWHRLRPITDGCEYKGWLSIKVKMAASSGVETNAGISLLNNPLLKLDYVERNAFEKKLAAIGALNNARLLDDDEERKRIFLDAEKERFISGITDLDDAELVNIEGSDIQRALDSYLEDIQESKWFVDFVYDFERGGARIGRSPVVVSEESNEPLDSSTVFDFELFIGKDKNDFWNQKLPEIPFATPADALESVDVDDARFIYFMFLKNYKKPFDALYTMTTVTKIEEDVSELQSKLEILFIVCYVNAFPDIFTRIDEFTVDDAYTLSEDDAMNKNSIYTKVEEEFKNTEFFERLSKLSTAYAQIQIQARNIGYIGEDVATFDAFFQNVNMSEAAKRKIVLAMNKKLSKTDELKKAQNEKKNAQSARNKLQKKILERRKISVAKESSEDKEKLEKVEQKLKTQNERVNRIQRKLDPSGSGESQITETADIRSKYETDQYQLRRVMASVDANCLFLNETSGDKFDSVDPDSYFDKEKKIVYFDKSWDEEKIEGFFGDLSPIMPLEYDKGKIVGSELIPLAYSTRSLSMFRLDESEENDETSDSEDGQEFFETVGNELHTTIVSREKKGMTIESKFEWTPVIENTIENDIEGNETTVEKLKNVKEEKVERLKSRHFVSYPGIFLPMNFLTNLLDTSYSAKLNLFLLNKDKHWSVTNILHGATPLFFVKAQLTKVENANCSAVLESAPDWSEHWGENPFVSNFVVPDGTNRYYPDSKSIPKTGYCFLYFIPSAATVKNDEDEEAEPDDDTYEADFIDDTVTREEGRIDPVSDDIPFEEAEENDNEAFIGFNKAEEAEEEAFLVLKGSQNVKKRGFAEEEIAQVLSSDDESDYIVLSDSDEASDSNGGPAFKRPKASGLFPVGTKGKPLSKKDYYYKRGFRGDAVNEIPHVPDDITMDNGGFGWNDVSFFTVCASVLKNKTSRPLVGIGNWNNSFIVASQMYFYNSDGNFLFAKTWNEILNDAFFERENGFKVSYEYPPKSINAYFFDETEKGLSVFKNDRKELIDPLLTFPPYEEGGPDIVNNYEWLSLSPKNILQYYFEKTRSIALRDQFLRPGKSQPSDWKETLPKTAKLLFHIIDDEENLEVNYCDTQSDQLTIAIPRLTPAFDAFVYQEMAEYAQRYDVTFPPLLFKNLESLDTIWFWISTTLPTSDGQEKDYLTNQNFFVQISRNELFQVSFDGNAMMEYAYAAIQLRWYAKLFAEIHTLLLRSMGLDGEQESYAAGPVVHFNNFRFRKLWFSHVSTNMLNYILSEQDNTRRVYQPAIMDWSNEREYDIDVVVRHNGMLYLSQLSNNTEEPQDKAVFWTKVDSIESYTLKDFLLFLRESVTSRPVLYEEFDDEESESISHFQDQILRHENSRRLYFGLIPGSEGSESLDEEREFDMDLVVEEKDLYDLLQKEEGTRTEDEKKIIKETVEYYHANRLYRNGKQRPPEWLFMEYLKLEYEAIKRDPIKVRQWAKSYSKQLGDRVPIWVKSLATKKNTAQKNASMLLEQLRQGKRAVLDDIQQTRGNRFVLTPINLTENGVVIDIVFNNTSKMESDISQVESRMRSYQFSQSDEHLQPGFTKYDCSFIDHVLLTILHSKKSVVRGYSKKRVFSSTQVVEWLRRHEKLKIPFSKSYNTLTAMHDYAQLVGKKRGVMPLTWEKRNA